MKKITALILGLIMVCSVGQMCAFAETNQAFVERAYQAQEGQMDVICAIPGQEGNGENCQAMLGRAERASQNHLLPGGCLRLHEGENGAGEGDAYRHQRRAE